jgi:acyl-CoA synthetase (AMP-forming)/AMP-acid ligase II
MAPPAILEPSVTLPAGDEPLKTVPVTQVEVSQDDDDSTIKTVDELVRRRARAHPDRVIVSYPSSGIEYVDYTMKQLDVYAFRAAKHYKQFLPTRRSSDEKPLVIALLGKSDFNYLVTMLALTKLGHTTLFLSTRISQEAIDNLLQLTGAEYFVVDERHHDIAEAAQKSLGLKGIVQIPGQSTYDFPIDVYADTRMDHDLDLSIETNNRVYIIHSSGKTLTPSIV